MENPMNIRTLSIVALVTAAVSSPVFAQDVDGAAPQKPAHALRHYRGTYNQVQGPAFAAPRVGADEGWSAEHDVDRARVGGHDPDFNPSGS
jgi:hypothetical protein